ncbi:MAG: head decoration protein [Vulcanimicrobiota bacterium]
METTEYGSGVQIIAFGGKPVAIPVTIAQDASATDPLPIGTVLGRIATSGKYAAYDDSNSDGTQVASGILDREVDHREGDGYGASMYIPRGGGFFREDALTGLDAAAKTDLGAISVPGRNILAM